MIGGMQDHPLRVTDLIDHAAREHGDREIVTRWADGSIGRSSWGAVADDARRLASALVALGLRPGDRVATLAMNHAHHLAAWYGVAGMGGVIHTINPRLFHEQLAYIVNHAADRVLLYDAMFAPIVEKLRPELSTVEHFIPFDGTGAGSFRALVDGAERDFAWIGGSERDPCGLCYTSGTTGNPKGVLYEHRSNVLHALAALQPDVFDLSTRSVFLPVVPMFHANAWGIPYAAAMVGAKLVFSCTNDAGALWEMFRGEGVTHSAGVPTVWLAMFAHMDANGGDYGALRRAIIGGSAAPRAMIERLMRAGIEVAHAWGMTETSPIGTIGSRPDDWDALSFDEQVDIVVLQGRVPFGAELKTVDDDGAELPRDGTSAGRLLVRGPWVLARYFGDDGGPAIDADGWFDTGDIAILHPDGVMQITDRAKDVIKSGGEWISSIELENAAVGCAGVAEAAAVGVRHPKWGERPLLLVVRKPGSAVTADDILSCLADKVAKWWLPDAIEFVDALPHTATGQAAQARDSRGVSRLSVAGGVNNVIASGEAARQSKASHDTLWISSLRSP